VSGLWQGLEVVSLENPNITLGLFGAGNKSKTQAGGNK
jgi:hypothetical protein